MFLKRKEHHHISTFIAIGANLPSQVGDTPLQTCESAIRAISAIPGLHSAVRSRWFSSAPVPPSDQSRYINGILRVEGEIAPDALLAALQAIEHQAGRVRSEANAARTLDLDIIDMRGVLRARPDPILPHPRAHLRSFVLLPLRDVAPEWVHPESGTRLESLIKVLPPQDIHPVWRTRRVAPGGTGP